MTSHQPHPTAPPIPLRPAWTRGNGLADAPGEKNLPPYRP